MAASVEHRRHCGNGESLVACWGYVTLSHWQPIASVSIRWTHCHHVGLPPWSSDWELVPCPRSLDLDSGNLVVGIGKCGSMGDGMTLGLFDV